MGEFRGTEQIISAKTKSKYQRSVDRSVVYLEYLTGKQGNCIEA